MKPVSKPHIGIINDHPSCLEQLITSTGRKTQTITHNNATRKTLVNFMIAKPNKLHNCGFTSISNLSNYTGSTCDRGSKTCRRLRCSTSCFSSIWGKRWNSGVGGTVIDNELLIARIWDEGHSVISSTCHVQASSSTLLQHYLPKIDHMTSMEWPSRW